MNTLQKQLFELQDLKYRDFHSKLIPGYNKENIIGILSVVNLLPLNIHPDMF